MNTLFVFFALPIATIILAIVLEKILRNPFLTAITFFAIYLIVAFAAFDAEFLVFVILYTILAFLAAVLAEIFFCRCRQEENQQRCRWCWNNRQNNNSNRITLSEQDVARIANQLASIQNNTNNTCNTNTNNANRDVVTANLTNNTTGGRSTWCCYRR